MLVLVPLGGFELSVLGDRVPTTGSEKKKFLSVSVLIVFSNVTEGLHPTPI